MPDTQNTPRFTKFVASPTLAWSNGDPLNGFAIVVIVFPTSSGTNWPKISIDPNSPQQTLPITATIPIVEGQFNSSVGVFYNEDLDPPNTKYCIYYFDSSMKQIGAPATSADFFTVTAASTNPPVYTFTVPIAGTAVPMLNT